MSVRYPGHISTSVFQPLHREVLAIPSDSDKHKKADDEPSAEGLPIWDDATC